MSLMGHRSFHCEICDPEFQPVTKQKIPWVPEVIFFARLREREIRGGGAKYFLLLCASRLGDVAPPRISLSISRKKITSGTQGKQKSATSFKMTGHEALLMTSLESILAIFMRRRRSFFQRMRFMSLHMRRIKRNAVKLAIQQQNHIHRRKRKTM